MAGLSSELFYVCAMLTNFRKPLVLKDYKSIHQIVGFKK